MFGADAACIWPDETELVPRGARFHFYCSKRESMPKLTVQGVGEFEVTQGKRLVKALIEDAGTDQLHACGGNARCTTCRVQFIAGEPQQITEAERDLLAARGITDAGIRLSCQISCDHDMTVEVISRLEGSGRKDQGSPVADEIQPPPVWTDKA